MPAKRQWLLANQNDCGGDFIVRNAQIRDTSARGVYAQAPGGLIEGCTIQNTGRAAVEFNTETGIWSQADYSSNVVVRNNTFRSVATNRRPGLLRHAGAVTILAFNGRTYIPRPGGHRNITIENNRFEDIDGLNILVCSAQDITIRGNQFINPMRNEKTFGVEKGVDPTSLIWINESSDVKLADNVVTNPGPFSKSWSASRPRARVPAWIRELLLPGTRKRLHSYVSSRMVFLPRHPPALILPRPAHGRRCSQGFTLMELLASIGIVAVLAALTLSGLRAVRSAGTPQNA